MENPLLLAHHNVHALLRCRSYKESDQLVMHPQPPEMLNTLFERGRRDALSWAQHIGLTAAAAAGISPATGLQSTGGVAGHATRLGDVRTLAPSGVTYLENQGAADRNKLDDATMAAHQQGHVGAIPSVAASSLLSVPVEQLPLIMPVPQKLYHML